MRRKRGSGVRKVAFWNVAGLGNKIKILEGTEKIRCFGHIRDVVR